LHRDFVAQLQFDLQNLVVVVSFVLFYFARQQKLSKLLDDLLPVLHLNLDTVDLDLITELKQLVALDVLVNLVLFELELVGPFVQLFKLVDDGIFQVLKLHQLELEPRELDGHLDCSEGLVHFDGPAFIVDRRVAGGEAEAVFLEVVHLRKSFEVRFPQIFVKIFVHLALNEQVGNSLVVDCLIRGHYLSAILAILKVKGGVLGS
jgi:hypothetical protein